MFSPSGEARHDDLTNLDVAVSDERTDGSENGRSAALRSTVMDRSLGRHILSGGFLNA